MKGGEFDKAFHVVNGAHVWSSLKDALDLDIDRILFNDVSLSVGPAPFTDDMGEWVSLRKKFAKDDVVTEQYWWTEQVAVNEVMLNSDRFVGNTAVVVWIAKGLPDQLLLTWMVYLFDRLELDLSRLVVVQIEQMLPGQHIMSLGEMRPEQIREFQPAPVQLTLAEVEELRRAWRVYTSDDPSDLIQYIAEPGPLPLLHEATSQLVDRYPDQRSGLNLWEDSLLRFTVDKGPKAVSAVGYTMGYVGIERLDYVSDNYLFPRLTALGHRDLASPLIKITGDSQIMRECRVALTPLGQKVLAGEANHVEVNGIDDWVGGVHLSSAAGNVTFRDGDSLVLL